MVPSSRSLRVRHDRVVAAEFAEQPLLVPMGWSTPVSEYWDHDGRHLLHRGAAGPFTYGEFAMRSIHNDVAGPL